MKLSKAANALLVSSLVQRGTLSNSLSSKDQTKNSQHHQRRRQRRQRQFLSKYYTPKWTKEEENSIKDENVEELLMECEYPLSSSSSSSQAQSLQLEVEEADVGILVSKQKQSAATAAAAAVTETLLCPVNFQCVPNSNSTKGGLCSHTKDKSPSDSNRNSHTNNDYVSKSETRLPSSQFVQRDMQKETFYDDITNDSCLPYEGTNSYQSCDCSNFDTDLQRGSFVCTIYDYYCLSGEVTSTLEEDDYYDNSSGSVGQDMYNNDNEEPLYNTASSLRCGSLTVERTFDEVGYGTSTTYCYSFVTPKVATVCYTYFTEPPIEEDEENSCLIQVDGIQCQSCQISVYGIEIYEGFTSYGCFEFDCTNTIANIEGVDCLGDFVVDGVFTIAAAATTPTPTTSPPTFSPTLRSTTSMPSPSPILLPMEGISMSPNIDSSSTVPSSEATFRPSIQDVPSYLPLSSPSWRPSQHPTTPQPTFQPSLRPSEHPTTLEPTFQPSLSPSYQPRPTLEPTFLPSMIPSNLPSKIPSFNPTIQPSVLPTRSSTMPSLNELTKVVKTERPTTDYFSSSNGPTNENTGSSQVDESFGDTFEQDQDQNVRNESGTNPVSSIHCSYIIVIALTVVGMDFLI